MAPGAMQANGISPGYPMSVNLFFVASPVDIETTKTKLKPGAKAWSLVL